MQHTVNGRINEILYILLLLTNPVSIAYLEDISFDGHHFKDLVVHVDVASSCDVNVAPEVALSAWLKLVLATTFPLPLMGKGSHAVSLESTLQEVTILDFILVKIQSHGRI